VDERAIEALRVRIAGKRLTDTVFPRYGRDGGPDSASAALSKMADQDWLEGHTGSHSQDDPDGLRDAGVHRDLANMIQGHTAGDEASKYGSSELPSQKREAAEHVWKFLLAK
jgi:hypothetical protein